MRPRDPTNLSFDQDGAELRQQAAADVLAPLSTALEKNPRGRAGVRISGCTDLAQFLDRDGAIGSIAAGVLGRGCRAVRAILFDKSAETNWSLPWHQDRTICVRKRVDLAGFGPWSSKGGLQHVEPPFDLLARMMTLRVHLDDVPHTNAPLLVAPGSHRFGRVSVDHIEGVVARCGSIACIAQRGDVWIYSTPILHASQAAEAPGHRRVLQVDFAAEELPGGLEWLGV